MATKMHNINSRDYLVLQCVLSSFMPFFMVLLIVTYACEVDIGSRVVSDFDLSVTAFVKECEATLIKHQFL